ncbi:MAG: ROK family protein [Methanoregulaceae archaeon]|nr:ROK family protein [Methanoregulaceae archaeon]
MEKLIAIDLGATHTRAAVVDAGGAVVKRVRQKTPGAGSDAAFLTAFLSGLIRQVCEGPVPPDIPGIGLSVAGPVDLCRGVLLNPPNMPFHDVPLTGLLADETGLPVRMVNDCHAGLLGELLYGIARGQKNVVYITLSTGIGGGVLANGRILLGRDGNAAEIGHLHVDSRYDCACGCGNRGHWEGYASGRHLPAFFSRWCEFHGKRCEGPDQAGDIFALARKGDGDAREFLEDLSRINARAVSDVIVAYDPELIVFDGSVMLANADLLLRPIIDGVDQYLKLPEMVLTGLAGDAPLLGASVIAKGYDTPFGDFTSPCR